MNQLDSSLPHATVATIVVKDDKFLLVHEHCSTGLVYNQPAGHIENGESILSAAIRETYEETGWTVEPTAVGGISVYHAPNGISYVRTTLIAAVISYDATAQLDAGIEAAVWFSYEDIKARIKELRSPIVLKVIEDYRRGQSYPLDMLSEHR